MTLGTLANEITRFEDISALEGRLPSKLKKIKKSVLGKHKKKKGNLLIFLFVYIYFLVSYLKKYCSYKIHV